MPGHLRSVIWGAVILSVTSSVAVGQQLTVGTPLRGGSSAFFEHFGFSFGFQHVTPNSMMFFRSGGGMNTWPSYGGFDPSHAGTFGIAGRSGDWSWNLNVSALQGSSYSSVSTTPTLTLQDGGFGFINDSVQRPFVWSFMPVVFADPQLQREAVLQRYQDATLEFVVERQRKRQAELRELQRLQKASRESLRQKQNLGPRPVEPALRLGSPGGVSAGDRPGAG